ncbi:MAG: AHH domain-containing protein [Flavobacterium sp.]|nr:AHH domain-containing protein [Flavobacterium sp.]
MNLKILKNTLLLFLTGIILTSCELQEEAIHQHEHNSNLKLYEMKFEELMTNKRFVNSFSKLPKSKKNLTTATLGRTVMENEYGFTIANKPAKVIEDNGETSYTFLITRDSTDANSFENLVIQTDSTNTTKAVIMKYNLTSPITSSADDSYSFTYNREITPIVYNNTTVSETSKMVIVCHWIYTLVCNNTRTGGIGPEHIAGPNCGRTYYNWTEECFSFDDGISNGGGSGPTGSGPTGGSTNTGSNVGSGGTGGANSINTSPVNNSIEFSETVSNFFQGLSLEQLKYWDDLSPREQKIIVDYLEQPGADVVFVKELMDLARQDTLSNNNAFNFVLQAQIQDKVENDLDEAFLESVNQYIDLNTTDPIVTQQLITYFSVKCAILRYQNPSWSDSKIYWEASKDLIHVGLDIFGLVPLIGELADLTNGVLYTIEGDGVNATLSYASAVPVAGWAATGTKLAIRINNVSSTAYTVATKVKLTWKIVGNVVTFGNRAQLRKVLGMGTSAVDPRQAHHIIPWNKQSKEIVQKAAKSRNAFHMNEALNGIPLSNAVHNGSHANYDNVIQIKFDEFNRDFPNATPAQCYTFLTNLIQQIRTWIANNPSTPINNIILP